MFTTILHNARSRLRRRGQLGLASFGLLVGTVAPVAAQASEATAGQSAPPNVLWILTDDAGYADFGFQGNEAFEAVTPTLDRLAAEGVTFSRAYVTSSVCSPSRAGMLTGQYQQRLGFQENLPGSWNYGDVPRWTGGLWAEWGLNLAQPTIADRLGEAGYATALVGKWHQGLSDKYAPNARGFDHFYGLRGGSRHFFPYDEPYRGEQFDVQYAYNIENALFENGQRQPEPPYLTDALGDKAAGWIADRPAEEPWFLFLSFTAPHTPMHADDTRLAWAREHFPDLKPGSPRLRYVAMMKAMDEAVSRVIGTLEERGELDETTIVFFNDNGGSAKNAADNGRLRGFKWSPWEGGIRVPMVVRWPGVTKPGTTIDATVSTLDLLPTHLAAAGVAEPEADLVGRDLRPLLAGEPPSTPRTLFWRESTSEGLSRVAMSGDWKLVDAEKAGRLLVDLAADPGETTNVIGRHAEVAARLASELEAWEATLPPPLW